MRLGSHVALIQQNISSSDLSPPIANGLMANESILISVTTKQFHHVARFVTWNKIEVSFGTKPHCKAVSL